MDHKDRNAGDRFSIWLSGILDNNNTQDRIRDLITVSMRAVTFSSVCILAATAAYTVLPGLETQYYPVAYNWRADNYQELDQPLVVGGVTAQPGDWLFDVYAVKSNRANCEYIAGQEIHALISVDSQSPSYEGTIVYINDDSPNSTRPTSNREQHFGRWLLKATPQPRQGAIVEAQVRHDCDLPWITVTNVGPFRLEEIERP